MLYASICLQKIPAVVGILAHLVAAGTQEVVEILELVLVSRVRFLRA